MKNPNIDELKKQIKQDSYYLTKNAWNVMPKNKRVELLDIFGMDKSFAEAKTTDDLIKRGGTLVLKDLHNVVKKWQKLNPKTRVNF